MQCTGLHGARVDEMGVQQCCAADAILAADYMESCGIVRRRRPFARLWECDCKAEGIAVLVDSAYDEEGLFWIDHVCLWITACSFSIVICAPSSSSSPTSHTPRR
jgi:hypothetical protein